MKICKGCHQPIDTTGCTCIDRSVFIAAFDSDCPNCDTLLEKGDEGVMVDGEAQHARCPARTRPQPVCSNCWLVHAPGQDECK